MAAPETGFVEVVRFLDGATFDFCCSKYKPTKCKNQEWRYSGAVR
jgi:hypothetical protein